MNNELRDNLWLCTELKRMLASRVYVSGWTCPMVIVKLNELKIVLGKRFEAC